jgi:putative transposase
MRNPREKMVGRPCYYHLYNRAAGPKKALPFDNVAKEKMFKLIVELGDYFLIETISATIMGSHFHVVVHAPGEPPTPEEAAKRHNDYHGLTGVDEIPKGKIELDPRISPDECEKVAAQMIDVSEFMRSLQQQFATWYNRMHERRGGLWADRFKSTILEGSREALWNCVEYVELNPVRAGMVEDPADYRFCSWGRYSGSGRHPFAKTFSKHMHAVAANHAGATMEGLAPSEVFAEFKGDLARMMAAERGKTSEEVHAAAERARTRGDSMPVRLLRRTRHWTDGAIIGGKAFVLEVGSRFHDPERVRKKQLSRGEVQGVALYCFKRLRTALE